MTDFVKAVFVTLLLPVIMKKGVNEYTMIV